MLPIATGGTSIGRIITVRASPLPRSRRPTSSASSSPSVTSAATATTTKTEVFSSAAGRTLSLASSATLAVAVKRLVQPQAQDLLDLRALGVTQFLRRVLLHLEISRHPAILGRACQIRLVGVAPHRNRASLGINALRACRQEPARERERSFFLRVCDILRYRHVPVAEHRGRLAADWCWYWYGHDLADDD